MRVVSPGRRPLVCAQVKEAAARRCLMAESPRDTESFLDTANLAVALTARYYAAANAQQLADPDARGAALRNCAHVVGAAAMTLNALHALSGQPEASVRAFLGITAGPTQAAVDDLLKVNKNALVTLVQFQVENLLSNVVRAAGETPGRTYAGVVEQALRLSNPSDEQESRRRFRVPGLVRNTLHNNGLHRANSESLDVDGFTFEFVDGERFSQAGWQHICWALTAELEAIEEMLRAPRVSEIEFVRDAYTDQVRE